MSLKKGGFDTSLYHIRLNDGVKKLTPSTTKGGTFNFTFLYAFKVTSIFS